MQPFSCSSLPPGQERGPEEGDSVICLVPHPPQPQPLLPECSWPWVSWHTVHLPIEATSAPVAQPQGASPGRKGSCQLAPHRCLLPPGGWAGRVVPSLLSLQPRFPHTLRRAGALAREVQRPEGSCSTWTPWPAGACPSLACQPPGQLSSHAQARRLVWSRMANSLAHHLLPR